MTTRNEKKGVEGNDTSSEDSDGQRARRLVGTHLGADRRAAQSIGNKSDKLIFSEVGYGSAEQFVFR